MTRTITPPTRLGPERPLRVHVVGNSAAVMVEPAHGPRDEGTYGEQLVTMLADAGVPTTVTHAGRWFGLVDEFVSRYERDIRDPFPDVLVLHFGMAECQSNVLSRRIVRHVTTWERTSRRTALAYRNRVVPPVWRVLRRYQRWAAAHDDRTHRLGPRRFRADYSRLIDLVRKDCAPLVLLVDIDPPGDRVEHWLPGTARRALAYNAILADIAASYDDGVRLIRASETLTDVKLELPDGLHRTPAGHRLTARLVTDEVLDWLKVGR